jgi:hypothetical protein
MGIGVFQMYNTGTFDTYYPGTNNYMCRMNASEGTISLANSSQWTITIDGNNNKINLGSAIRLDAKYNALVLSNKANKDCVWIHADPSNGGSGISLRDQNEKETIKIDADNSLLFIKNTDAGDLIKMDGRNGVILLGSPKTKTYTVGIDGTKGDITLWNADCAEDFEISPKEQVDPGTVMTLNDDGKLVKSEKEYDKKVAGVISGAGNLQPGLVLGRQPGHADRVPLALMGRVNCKVDAEYDRVEVGDLLTTSDTPGHAMKASDPTKSFGAVIGKALKPLKVGQGLIPILVTLQ